MDVPVFLYLTCMCSLCCQTMTLPVPADPPRSFSGSYHIDMLKCETFHPKHRTGARADARNHLGLFSVCCCYDTTSPLRHQYPAQTRGVVCTWNVYVWDLGSKPGGFFWQDDVSYCFLKAENKKSLKPAGSRVFTVAVWKWHQPPCCLADSCCLCSRVHWVVLLARCRLKVTRGDPSALNWRNEESSSILGGHICCLLSQGKIRKIKPECGDQYPINFTYLDWGLQMSDQAVKVWYTLRGDCGELQRCESDVVSLTFTSFNTRLVLSRS